MFKNLNGKDVFGILVNGLLCGAGMIFMGLIKTDREHEMYKEEVQRKLEEENDEEEES